MTAMRSAVLHAVNDLRVEDKEVPEPGPGEVLVRVAVCGVCGSDATEYSRGPVLTVMPVTHGHEFVGTVAALGPGVTSPPVGATVVCGAGISCGECKPCRQGRTNLCRNYTTIGLQHDGGLAGFVTAPVGTLLDVSGSGLSLDTLGLSQPMSIAVHGRVEIGSERVGVVHDRGDSVVGPRPQTKVLTAHVGAKLGNLRGHVDQCGRERGHVVSRDVVLPGEGCDVEDHECLLPVRRVQCWFTNARAIA
jgi:threonine dehydrogenase-like Zn-dependent dehydrogenase